MKEKRVDTEKGSIWYMSDIVDPTEYTLVFLPGLTADHRLFEKQIEYFKGKYNIFVWDAPGHNNSRPFTLDFSLDDKAQWLYEILKEENISRPVIVGQSMGGYVGQAFGELYPKRLKGLVCIDTAPLQKKYYSSAELWMLRRMEPVYMTYPWQKLLKQGTEGVAESDYGRQLMMQIMMTYDSSRMWYAKLAGHGYRMLADAVESGREYEISCPVMIICGEKDKAGSTKKYNRKWEKRTGMAVNWIKDAGHNSNTDKPEEVNALIDSFMESLK